MCREAGLQRGVANNDCVLQMKQSMAAAQQAQQHSMELAAQQQHQHHQSMAAAYGQGMPSGTPFQAAQEQRAAPQGLRLSNSQRNLSGAATGALRPVLTSLQQDLYLHVILQHALEPCMQSA